TAQPLPFRTASAERRQIIEVRVLSSELQEFLMIVNIFLRAASEKQKETPAVMAGWIGQKPVQHGTKRSNTCAGSNKDGVADWRVQNEITKRTLATDFFAFPHVAQKVRHEAVLNSIETESESIVLRGRRSDGVGASELFAIG